MRTAMFAERWDRRRSSCFPGAGVQWQLIDTINMIASGSSLANSESKFRLDPSKVEDLATGFGSCIASDRITIEGYPVRFMYREHADEDLDSGWRFFSGYEDEEYENDASKFALYDVNTIANYDRSIIPFLGEPAGSVFEKATESERFVRVTDWAPPED